jgi:RNA polymerase sigma-70 factor (ECF subfamily)
MRTGALAWDFADFYEQEFGRVVGSVRWLAGASAEDVAQEAFIVAQQRWDEVATLEVPFAWVRRVALRIARRRAERDRIRPTLESARMRVCDGFPSHAVDLDLLAALSELPSRHAQAVWLYHLEDRPIVEVAERLGCSVSAAKVLLMRTRRHLAARLGGWSGTWMSERSWTADAIVGYLDEISAGEHVGVVLDDDLEGRGGRWGLTLADDSYRLFRDDGVRLDDGACHIRRMKIEFVPASSTGHVVFEAAIDGNRMRMSMLENTTQPTRGVPDRVWMSLFVESGPFRYVGQARSPI